MMKINGSCKIDSTLIAELARTLVSEARQAERNRVYFLQINDVETKQLCEGKFKGLSSAVDKIEELLQLHGVVIESYD